MDLDSCCHQHIAGAQKEAFGAQALKCPELLEALGFKPTFFADVAAPTDSKLPVTFSRTSSVPHEC